MYKYIYTYYIYIYIYIYIYYISKHYQWNDKDIYFNQINSCVNISKLAILLISISIPSYEHIQFFESFTG